VDGRERALAVDSVPLRTGSAWAGVRLEETRSGPRELPEACFGDHVVVLNLYRPVRAETTWGGCAVGGEVTIAPEGVTLFPAGVPFVTRWRDPAENVVVALSPGLVAAGIGGARGPVRLRPALGAEDPFAAHLVLALRDLARAGENPAAALHAETLASILAAHLVRAYGGCRPSAEARGALGPARLGRIAAYVGERLAHPLPLRELAAVAGMGVYQFARTFKAAAGVAPHHYVLARRLERAKALLQGTTLPVGDIAARCGFSHPSHLTATFQRAFATTPSRYRRTAAFE
jgi:AraC family transcriptional regulator